MGVLFGSHDQSHDSKEVTAPKMGEDGSFLSHDDKVQLHFTNSHNTRQINELRNKHRIKVWGSDVPHPIESFNQLDEVYQVKHYILNNIQVMDNDFHSDSSVEIPLQLPFTHSNASTLLHVDGKP
jgi:ATP-dependent RNA helicase DDX52/ROK1